MCKKFKECWNPVGEDGYCDNHRGNQEVRMTAAELKKHGVDVALSHSGQVVPSKLLPAVNAADLEVMGNGESAI